MRAKWFVIALLLNNGAIATDEWSSNRGLFVLTIQSSLEPIVINTMHSWELSVTTADGDSVSGATFEVTGGMPEHDHGLATAPRVTEELGDGRYRLDGMRFHMNGEWELNVTIRANGYTDRFKIVLSL